MKVLLLNTETNEKKFVNYPRADMGEVQGLDKNIQYYGIVEAPRPECDYNTHKLIKVETFKDDPFEGKSYLKTYMISYEKVQKSNEEIIQVLNTSFENHVSQYPEWKRLKHDREERNGTTPERLAYITNLFEWLDRCREERNKRELELINNNIIPSFEWEQIP